MKFTSAREIAAKQATITAYVRQAVAAAKAGRKVETGAAVPSGVVLHKAGSSYCLETTVSGRVWHAIRQAKPVAGACPAK